MDISFQYYGHLLSSDEYQSNDIKIKTMTRY